MTIFDYAYADELDRIAATQPGRTPVRPAPVRTAAPALPACIDCRRPMRPHRTHIADWPDTIARGDHQRCRGCYDRHRTGGKRRHRTVPTGTPCTSCHRPMRPHRIPKTEAPDTVLHHKAGLCWTCHKETC